MIILPIISLTLVAGLTRYITRTWISPGAFFSLCWSFFLIVPIIFASEYKIDHLPLWFITIFSMSLGAGSIIAYSLNPIQSKRISRFELYTNIRFLYHVLVVFCSIIIFGLYLLIQYATKEYSSLNYINDWMMIPNMIAVDRYAGQLDYPFIIKYSLYFIYPGNLLAGLLFASKGKSIKFLLFFPLFAAILLGIIEGARTSILLGLILFSSAWLSVSTLRYSGKIDEKKSYFKVALSIGSFITIFLVFFIFIQWLRQGMDTIIFDLLIDRIRAYFFGYLAAFTQWMSGPVELNFNIGFITFAGPYNLIGIVDRPLGFYDPIQIGSGISTNIFTAFRGIIMDFSLPGSIIISFIIGFVTQTIFQGNNRTNLLSTLPISMFYAFTLYSPLISIFHYNSIFFSWVILIIILTIAKHEPLDNYS